MDKLKTTIQKETVLELKGDSIKVQPCSRQDYATILKTASKENWQFFTHNPPKNNLNKYVLKGLPLHTEPTTIQYALLEKGIDLKQIRQMTKTCTDENNTHSMRKIPVWVLTVNNSGETRQKIKDLRGLLYFKITIEELRNKQTVTQCLRCQGFGHKAQYCKLTRKCRICAELHDTRECPNRLLPLKCAGCGGGHQAPKNALK